MSQYGGGSKTVREVREKFVGSFESVQTASRMDVIARFREGDEDAIREIYRRHGGSVRTVAASIVGDPELASEVVQQTFLKAWQAAASFDGDRELTPWLYSIARRTAIDVLRREGRRPQGVPAEEHETATATIGFTFERTWEAYEIRQALDALPAEERDVVRLSHLMGLKHAEIATKLGIPIGTVKSRSNRAHRRLAASLRHLLDDEVAANQTSSANQNPTGDVGLGE